MITSTEFLTQEEKIQKLKDTIRPEVREYLEALKTLPETTKHHYGNVMSFISKLPSRGMQKLFLAVMIEEGYDRITASQIYELMGW